MQHNRFFHATRAEAFPRFCATPAEASCGLSLSFAEARKHALKNILCHRRLPRSLENYFDHPPPSSPQTYLLYGATMLLEHIAAKACLFIGCAEYAFHKHYQLAMLPHIHYKLQTQYSQYSQPPHADDVAPRSPQMNNICNSRKHHQLVMSPHIHQGHNIHNFRDHHQLVRLPHIHKHHQLVTLPLIRHMRHICNTHKHHRRLYAPCSPQASYLQYS